MHHLAAGLRRTAQPFGWTTSSRLSQPGHLFEGHYRSFYTSLLFAEICNGLVNVEHDVLNPAAYNADLDGAYRPALDDAPDQELRCYILGTKPKGGGSADQIYFIPRTFLKQPKGDDTAVLDALDATMKAKGLDFFAAMRALIVQVGLAQIARSRSVGNPLLIIEDGGYTAPIFNDAALSGSTVAEMRARYSAPTDTATDTHLPASIKEVVTGTIFGSVEHTRNGSHSRYNPKALSYTNRRRPEKRGVVFRKSQTASGRSTFGRATE